MDTKRMYLCSLIILAASCLSHAAALRAQVTAKPDEECRKLVPTNWGPNFGEEWRQHEAVYWGCRLGVSSRTVGTWQHAANLVGSIENIVRVTLDKQDVVLIEEGQGTMHCLFFSALVRNAKRWEKTWEYGDDSSCIGTCPIILMRVHGLHLILEWPQTGHSDCDRFSHKETYLWNGKTFIRADLDK